MSTRAELDAIVIGAGHNGLVTAAYLAKAGLKVAVFEQRKALGGASASEAVFPGFRVDTGTFDAGLFLPEIISDLRLEEHGLKLISNPAVVHAVQPDGEGLTLWRDPQRAAQEIARFSPADAGKYPQYLARLGRIGAVLERIVRLAPPNIPDLGTADILSWAPVALKARRLGRKDMMELVRVLPLPVSEFLDEWFESEALKAALGMAGIFGNTLGPMSPGTTFMLLYQSLNAGQAGFRASRFVEGGMGCLVQALADAARSVGAQIHVGQGVEKILLEDGRAKGVLLESGGTLQAKTVVSSADPRTTFFELIGAPNLELRFMREVRNIRYRGSLARLNLALSGLPASLGGPDTQDRQRWSGRIIVCPSLDYLERAYDEAKYGRLPEKMVLDAAIPSLSDPQVAPPGKHLMEINVQYPPYRLKESNWDAERGRLGDRVIEILDQAIPGIQDLIIDRQVLTPLDLERQYGLPEGCIYHGQMVLDQLLFMRPVPGYSSYRTPVDGLYLCGSGTHPGGGLTGAPGRNAARVILQDS